MAVFDQERPSIHVALQSGADAALYRWVQIGAEEEGVPCRIVEETADSPIALAYAASLSSRFRIGVAVAGEQVVLHETHMPVDEPVLAFGYEGNPEDTCRLMGSNAARMIVRKPFRFKDELSLFGSRKNGVAEDSSAPAYVPASCGPYASAPPTDMSIDPVQVAKLVAVIVRKLEERGIR